MTHSLVPRPATLPAVRPTVALALGGGGARGLAHILMIEALEELGVVPVAIAGTSIGAVFGAALASGMTARQMRAHATEVLGQRFDLARQLLAARAQPLTGVWSLLTARAALLDPETLLGLLLPSRIASDFGALEIPLSIVATDFYGQDQVVFREGPLHRAVAASIALPAVFQPVVIEERALVDGGLVNPLPFDLLVGAADIIVAIDVTGAPRANPNRAHPSPIESLVGASYIFERTIIREKLRSRQPDVYIDAQVSGYQVADFLKLEKILEAAEPAKQQLKTQLARVLASEVVR
ncbi:MAG: patatin-like phospholipase family protein [Hyphomicrobiaceae bacterium]